MFSSPQGREAGELRHWPFMAHNVLMKSFLESKFTCQIARAACALVTPVSQLISQLCQVAHLEASYSKALGSKGVFCVGD